MSLTKHQNQLELKFSRIVFQFFLHLCQSPPKYFHYFASLCSISYVTRITHNMFIQSMSAGKTWQTSKKSFELFFLVFILNVLNFISTHTNTWWTGCHPDGPGQPKKWAHGNLTGFNKTKYNMLHLGQSNPQDQNRLGNEQIKNNPAEKDLGVLVDVKLDLSQQTNFVLGCIKNSLPSRSREEILLLTQLWWELTWSLCTAAEQSDGEASMAFVWLLSGIGAWKCTDITKSVKKRVVQGQFDLLQF